MVDLTVQPFECQCLHPFGNDEVGYLRQLCCAGQLGAGVHQAVEALAKPRRAFQHHLGDALAITAVDGRIVILHHVEHHVVIGAVTVVAMTPPVGGTHMNFDIPYPYATVNLDLGVEEVGSSIVVEQPWVKHTHAQAIVGDHVLAAPQAVLPHIL